MLEIVLFVIISKIYVGQPAGVTAVVAAVCALLVDVPSVVVGVVVVVVDPVNFN